MGNKERDKGARFERLVARILGTERVGTRGKEDTEHGDIVHPVYFIQCKHYKRIRVCRWYDETESKARQVNKIPLVVLKEDRGQPLVLISLQDFLRLQERSHGAI